MSLTADAPIKRIRWLKFKNASQQVIPPFAVLNCLGTQNGVMMVGPPTSDNQQNVYTNSQATVPIQGYGSCTADSPCFVAYNNQAGTPQIGQQWGTKAGDFYLEPNQTGFRVIGEITVNPTPHLMAEHGNGSDLTVSDNPGFDGVPFTVKNVSQVIVDDSAFLEITGGGGQVTIYSQLGIGWFNPSAVLQAPPYTTFKDIIFGSSDSNIVFDVVPSPGPTGREPQQTLTIKANVSLNTQQIAAFFLAPQINPPNVPYYLFWDGTDYRTYGNGQAAFIYNSDIGQGPAANLPGVAESIALPTQAGFPYSSLPALPLTLTGVVTVDTSNTDAYVAFVGFNSDGTRLILFNYEYVPYGGGLFVGLTKSVFQIPINAIIDPAFGYFDQNGNGPFTIQFVAIQIQPANAGGEGKAVAAAACLSLAAPGFVILPGSGTGVPPQPIGGGA